MATQRPKRDSIVTPERIFQHRIARFNPIKTLTPESLTRQIEDFQSGTLRDFALTMDAIERRDDVLQCVAPKRRAAVSRLGFQIITDPDADPSIAEAHKETLQYFYTNLEATNAIDRNQRRGFALLVDQMLTAVGFKYAAHEVLWKPTPEGLTACFNFVPLWFFENRTGLLRFLPHDYAYDGEELRRNGWMVTVGQGLMEACAVAYMFKHLPLKDWLLYCEKHGMPGIHGKTDAPQGSAEWDNMVEAVSAVAADFSCVTGKEDEIAAIDFSQQGELPFPGIVDRMDRALAALWRGADLSTMSAGQGSGEGASLQGGESDLLEADDARLVSETLQIQIDPLVLQWAYGPNVVPAAWVEVVVPEKEDVDREIKVDEFLIKHGAPIGIRETLERYGRPMPDEDEVTLTAAQPAPAGDLGGRIGSLFANERSGLGEDVQLLNAAIDTSAEATAQALEPLRNRIETVLSLRNDAAFATSLRKLQKELPSLLEEINTTPENALAIEAAMSAGLFNGMAEEIARAELGQ